MENSTNRTSPLSVPDWKTTTTIPKPKYHLTTLSQQPLLVPAKDSTPVYLYTKASDATYAPPHQCNMKTPAKIPSTKKNVLVYRMIA